MNLENDENENLINQEPEFITFGDHPGEEISQEEDPGEEISQEEDPGEEISQEEDPGEEISETQAETQVDYSQDFLILENLGYIQISMIGALLFYFVLSLVIKFLRSFF